VLVRRTDDNQKQAYLMNYDAAACGEKPSDDIQLAAHDVQFVLKTGVADRVYSVQPVLQAFLPSNIGLKFGTSF